MIKNPDRQRAARVRLIRGGRAHASENRLHERKAGEGYTAFGEMNYKIWKQIENEENER